MKPSAPFLFLLAAVQAPAHTHRKKRSIDRLKDNMTSAAAAATIYDDAVNDD